MAAGVLSMAASLLCLLSVVTAQEAQQTQERQQDRDQQSQRESATSTHSGVVVSVSAEDRKLTMTAKGAEGKEHSHTVAENARITIDGKAAELSDLRKGDTIRVTTPEGNTEEAVAIQATREQQDQDAAPQGNQRRQPPGAPQPPAARDSQPRGDQPPAPSAREAQDRPGQPPATQPREGQPREGQAAGGERRDTQSARRRLGVMIAPSPTSGVLVMDVQPQGPAARAGIRPGDYLMEINGEKITTTDQFQNLLRDAGEEELQILLWRNGEQQRLNVSLGEMPPGQGDQQASRQGEQESEAWLGVRLVEDQGRPLGQQPGQQFPGQQQPGQQQPGQLQPGQQQPGQQQPGQPGQQPGQPQAGQQQPQQQAGALVRSVYPSGPAARAGIRSGDVITRIGEEEIRTAQDVIEAIQAQEPNQQVEIHVRRGDREVPMQVTLGERSEFLGPRFEAFRPGEFGGQQGYGQQGTGQQDFGEGEEFPEHAMMLEFQRRQAEQNMRIEKLVRELSQEVQALRRELQQQAGGAPAGDAPRTQPPAPGQQAPGQEGAPGAAQQVPGQQRPQPPQSPPQQ